MPELTDVPRIYQQIAAVLLIMLGAVECFFGYAVFRALMVLVAFVGGAILGGALGLDWSGGQQVWALIGAIAGGMIGALTVGVIYFAAVFVVGAQLGYVAGAAAATAMGWQANPLILLVPAVVVGVIAVALQRPLIIIATSFGGAWLVVASVLFLLRGTEVLSSAALIGWLILGVFGVFIQFGATGASKGSDSPPEPTQDS